MTNYNRPQPPQATGVAVPPLHTGPLTFGTLFSRGFRAVAQNPKPLVLWAMLLPLAMHLVFAVPTALYDASGLGDPTPSGVDPAALGVAALMMVSTIIYAVVSALGGAVLQGFVANNVRFEALGHRGTSAELWAATRPLLGRLLGYGGLVLGFAFAAGFVAGILGFLGGLLFVGIAAAISPAMGPAIVAFVLLTIAIGIPLFWFAARISLAPAVIVCEGVGGWASLQRSWALTRGRSWRVVGLYLLIALVMGAAIGLLSLLFWAVTQALVPAASWEIGVTGPRVLAAYLSGLPVSLASAAFLPVLVTAITNVYLDARTRHDPLAASLQQYHAARAAGYQPAQLPDPFAVAPQYSSHTNAQVFPPTPPAPPAPPTPWGSNPADPPRPPAE
ncbi:hypothetical protein ACFSWE_01920 [Leucobacter albus]|uniref:DUF7847 domain-containing protein n=1 Tax=Leucobacter albus TaxID=272210 RepID=A0ABW3TM20_9MICO